jgi:site-specific recombinase XerD
MRCAGATPHGLRTRALVVLLGRAGLRVSEALALSESDLDRWGWQQLQPWLECASSSRSARCCA